MKDTDIYSRITTEQVLEIFKYYDAASLKAQQTKLSGAATQLEKLTTGPLRGLLELEESALIKQAGELIRSLNLRVEHAKEVKKRDEVRRQQLQKEHEIRIKHAIQDLLPRPEPSCDAAMDSALLLLGLHKEKIALDFYSVPEVQKAILKRFDDTVTERQSCAGFIAWLYDDIERGVRDAYCSRDIASPRDELLAALQRVEAGQSAIKALYKQLLGHMQSQLAIEQSSNVERLPLKKKR
ncbi:hypothetical protein [Pseudomonas sp. 2FE]|uniref:hypothetical protein n=1 Tax=Pseudomonas sp. 2FE TaxID=2502190 RepID=UPI0010F7FBF9|nr:hypothetical protein [Pseudomonas sp. 2FE]